MEAPRTEYAMFPEQRRGSGRYTRRGALIYYQTEPDAPFAVVYPGISAFLEAIIVVARILGRAQCGFISSTLRTVQSCVACVEMQLWRGHSQIRDVVFQR